MIKLGTYVKCPECNNMILNIISGESRCGFCKIVFWSTNKQFPTLRITQGKHHCYIDVVDATQDLYKISSYNSFGAKIFDQTFVEKFSSIKEIYDYADSIQVFL